MKRYRKTKILAGRMERARQRAVLRGGVALLAMTAIGMAGPALAQQAPADASADSNGTNLETIVVVGVRRALESAQQIKKDADTVVDSITATDIGAFPDKSASEALQRVPGITVNRLQSNDDSTHPSGEPTNILIRGLTQVRTELNGRDTFSADSARGFNFNDVSPELLYGVDSYKNQTAEMIEGGIAGSVNLRTRRPFDQDGQVIVVNGIQDYGDRSKHSTSEVSALLSDTINTDVGRFGYLVDIARSHVISRVESVIDDKIDTYCTGGYGTASAAIVNADGSIPCTGNPFGGSSWAFAPDGVRYSRVDYDRHRTGNAIAGQYANDAKTLEVTLQYIDSNYRNAWLEDASHAVLDGSYFGTPAFNPRGSSILGPADGSAPLVFGSNGMLQSGQLTQGHGSFFGTWSPDINDAINAGSAIPGVPFVNDCFGGACTTLRDGLYFQNEARNFAHEEGTRDYSGHVSWTIQPRLKADFDAQYVEANTFNNDILVATGSMANDQYSLNGNGMPQVQFLPGSNVNYATGGLTNPHNYWLPFIQGHVEDNEGSETALRADLKYDFADHGWLDSLKVGARHADRDQTVRYSTFNWTPIAASWNCNGPGFNIDNTTPGAYPTSGSCGGNTGHPNFKGYGAGIWGTDNFNGFFGSGTYPNGPLVFLNRATLTNFPRLVSGLSGNNTNSPLGGGYTPICDRPGLSDGSCFQPAEQMRVRELTDSVYGMLYFGGDQLRVAGKVVVGNIGLRIVRTQEDGIGNVQYPDATALNALAPCATPLGPNSVVNPSCYLTPGILAFANGGGTPGTYSSSHVDALPSLNVRLTLRDDEFVRFGYARAISRPDFGYLRNFVQINPPIINTGPDSPYVVYNSPTAAHTAANVTGYNFVFAANAGNSALRPEKADQVDLTYERYWGRGSSLALDVFYKKLSDRVALGQFDRPFTNGGSTQTVRMLGPFNTHDGGNLDGFEVAYQTFFDRLPGAWSGLGVQANYTYVRQNGINNTNLANAGGVAGPGSVGAFGAGVNAVLQPTIDSHRLAGISDHTVNVVGLYERGSFAARLAYNWRSRYLTDNLDCCIGLPVFQKASGFLDGSIRYSLGGHLELSLAGSNLLNTTAVYQQEVFGDSLATPGARPVYFDSGWSRNDRRFQLGLRAKF
ncbi:MAG TPA: TonB-dependent receptor [Steroidobacteraceae bacterium]|nr:TonB-dependent receptor [Steroidobacteraceae bacterium]